MDLRHDRGLAGAADRCARQLDHALLLELRQQLLRLRPRQQHGVTEMPAGPLAAQHRGEENPLVDLEPALFALQAVVLGGDLLRARHQARHDVGGLRDQVLDPHEARALVRSGDRRPHRRDRARKRVRDARAASWMRSAAAAFSRSLRCALRGNRSSSAVDIRQYAAEGPAIRRKFTGRRRFRARPGVHFVIAQPGRRKSPAACVVLAGRHPGTPLHGGVTCPQRWNSSAFVATAQWHNLIV